MKSKSIRRFSKRYDLPLLRRWEGGKIFRRSRAPSENASQDLRGTAQIIDNAPDTKLDAAPITQIDRSPIAENDDVWKTRIHRRWLTWREKRARRRNRKISVRAWRWLRAHLKRRELTAAELADRAENEERQRLEKFHREQAKLAARMLRETLTRLTFCTRSQVDGRMKITAEVGFDVIQFSPLAYYFHVGHYPYGVSTVDLITDEVCTDLANAVGHRVRAINDYSIGLVYVIEVGSTMGIPDFVSFGEMIELMPKNLPMLSFPVGVASNGRRLYRSLEEMPHLLVAGGTGKGKSNEINAIICSLLMRNTPQQMQLVLFDLKRGIEFGGYSGVPHLVKIPNMRSDIVEDIDEVLAALEWVIQEGERRLDIIKKSGKRDISGYNRNRKKKRLPKLVLIIDEWANIKIMLGKDAERLLTSISNLFRAAGIHVILATQNPKSEIVNTTITTNFAVRMAFSMPQYASQTVIGSWDAWKLEPRGRMIYQSPQEQLQIQAPRITDATIAAVVAAAKGESNEVEMRSLDAEEVLDWALDHLGGSLSKRQLFEQFHDRTTQAELNAMLQAMEGETYIVDGTAYTVQPGRGNQPRKMILATTAP